MYNLFCTPGFEKKMYKQDVKRLLESQPILRQVREEVFRRSWALCREDVVDEVAEAEKYHVLTFD